jgi:hypothetical protein
MLFRKIAFFLIVFSVSTSTYSQHSALSKIDTDDLKRHLTFIASDELQGRKFGTEVDGLEITANYLADEAKKIGLKPGAEDFFQKVNIVGSKTDSNSLIQIETKKKIVYNSSSFIRLSCGTDEVQFSGEEVVLLGFGFEKDEDSFSALNVFDIKGKVVLIAQGNVKAFKTGESFRWSSRLERKKIELISKKNPKAILIVTNPQDKQNNTFNQISRYFNRERYELKSEKEKPIDMPSFIVLPELADKLLGRKGKYEKYLKSLIKKNEVIPILAKGKTVTLKSNKTASAVDAKNVLAIIQGTDPELKNEYMVFMAHYDHLGLAENGDVYNGADDNGSGTVTLLEVAEAFMSLKQKPKRSLVFLWVTAEEVGLLGSKYYAENAIFPLDKTVACINIDMDGRVYEPRDSVWNKSPKVAKDFDGLYTLSNQVWPGLKEINTLACKELGLIPDYSLPPNFFRSSDHYHFHKNNVPILNFATGYHADYHKVGDEVSRINFDKMKRVADLCFLVGLEVANRKQIEFETK